VAGKYFDEWILEEFTPTRTITETDVVMFAALGGDYTELHTNNKFGKTTLFGQRIVHGLLGLAISHGLIFRLGILKEIQLPFRVLNHGSLKRLFSLVIQFMSRLKLLTKKPAPANLTGVLLSF
jgi:acyl dehydratase